MEATIEEKIVALVKEWAGIERSQREQARGQEILHDLQLIGRTAAFFDGYWGMKKLHDAAEDIVGNDNSIGYWLNWMWDGIGSWCA